MAPAAGVPSSSAVCSSRRPLIPGSSRSSRIRQMRALALAVGWTLVVAIIWLSLTPKPPELALEHGDKLGHFGAYGAALVWFCLLYRRGAAPRAPPPRAAALPAPRGLARA